MRCLTEPLTHVGQVAQPARGSVKVIAVYSDGKGRVEIPLYVISEPGKGWIQVDVVQGQIFKWYTGAYLEGVNILKIDSIKKGAGEDGTMKFTACWGDRPRPSVEPEPAGFTYIGNINYDPKSSPGMDEIVFEIPITNVDIKSRWFYVELYDQSGKEIDREPDFVKPLVGVGETHIITISSVWKKWHIGDVQGQTVKFVLKSKRGLLDKYETVETKTFPVEKYTVEIGTVEEPKKDKVEIINMFYPEEVKSQKSYEMKFTVGLVSALAVTSGKTIIQLIDRDTNTLIGEKKINLNHLINRKQEVAFKGLMLSNDQHYKVVVIDNNIWPVEDTIQDSRDFTVKFDPTPVAEDDEEEAKSNMILYLIVFVLVFGVFMKKRS